VLVWRAADRLGIGVGDATPAVAAGLLEFGARVRFRHPLVRSAVYRAAAPEDRRRVPDALAEATDPDVDPDRRAWHRSQAAPGPDENVASELERSAGRVRRPGRVAAAAAFELIEAATRSGEPTWLRSPWAALRRDPCRRRSGSRPTRVRSWPRTRSLIGARLLISPRTVEYHPQGLRQARIRSRTELGDALPAGPNAALPV
jgi:hypothetical protein